MGSSDNSEPPPYWEDLCLNNPLVSVSLNPNEHRQSTNRRNTLTNKRLETKLNRRF